MGSFDTIRHLPQAYRRLSRFRHIVRVLFKYGFDTISLRERVPQTLKRMFMPWKKDETTEIAAQYSMPERLRMAFVELGPTFVKLGQVLAQRQDMIPPEFVHARTARRYAAAASGIRFAWKSALPRLKEQARGSPPRASAFA